MPSIEVTLSVKQDGVEISNFPQIRRPVPTGSVVLDAWQKVADNNTSSFTSFPGVPADLQGWVIMADQPLNIRVNGSSTAIPLNAYAILACFATDVTAGASTNLTVNNPAASQTANIWGMYFGT